MNKHQHKARKAKNDEYYTLYSDVAAEILPHRHQLKGKRVHCPFSDYRKSQVVHFLVDFFHILGLAHLTATCFDNGDGAWRFDYDGKTATVSRLTQGGSFSRGNGDHAQVRCGDRQPSVQQRRRHLHLDRGGSGYQ